MSDEQIRRAAKILEDIKKHEETVEYLRKQQSSHELRIESLRHELEQLRAGKNPELKPF